MQEVDTGTMDEVTVSSFQDTVDSWLQVRKEIDDIEDSIKPLQEKRRELEASLIQMLEATGLEKFQGRLGSVQKRVVEYVNQPSEEERDKFLQYLISNGELSDVVTFHQGRLTSWFKSKKEEKGFEFTAPGLGEMKQRIELRKGK